MGIDECRLDHLFTDKTAHVLIWDRREDYPQCAILAFAYTEREYGYHVLLILRSKDVVPLIDMCLEKGFTRIENKGEKDDPTAPIHVMYSKSGAKWWADFITVDGVLKVVPPPGEIRIVDEIR